MDPATDHQCHLGLAGDMIHGTGITAGAGGIHTMAGDIHTMAMGILIITVLIHTDIGMATMPVITMDITDIHMGGTTGITQMEAVPIMDVGNQSLPLEELMLTPV